MTNDNNHTSSYGANKNKGMLQNGFIKDMDIAKWVNNNLYLLTAIHNTNITKVKWNKFSKQKVSGISTPVHYIKLQTAQN